jgi:hypothetical protein
MIWQVPGAPERTWRTREDLFAEVWPEVHEQLQEAPGLEAKTLFAWLQTKYSRKFDDSQLRSFQRGVKRCQRTFDCAAISLWPGIHDGRISRRLSTPLTVHFTGPHLGRRQPVAGPTRQIVASSPRLQTAGTRTSEVKSPLTFAGCIYICWIAVAFQGNVHCCSRVVVAKPTARLAISVNYYGKGMFSA